MEDGNETRTFVGDFARVVQAEDSRRLRRMVLVGPRGAAAYCYQVPPPALVEALDNVSSDVVSTMLTDFLGERIQPLDLGTHRPPVPNEADVVRECEFLTGGRCVYEGTATGAMHLAEALAELPEEKQEEAVWRVLEAHHDDLR